MSARWKRENPDTLIMMHAHNRWSNLYTKVIQAADILHIPFSVRESENHYDGSADREWIVPKGWKKPIYTLAYAMIEQRHDDLSDY